MKKKHLILIAIILFLIAMAPSINEFTSYLITGHVKGLVVRVIDGDTMEIMGGQKVRLLGINAPEKGQYCWNDSKGFLESLVLRKNVGLERDRTETDSYNRLLRHIHLDQIHVNLLLVENGFAKVYINPPDTKYESEFNEAERRAKENNLCVWQYSNIPDVYCLGIFQMHSNAAGDDRQNLNDEFVVFRNSCKYPVELGGYRIEDSGDAEYTFPDITIDAKSEITLHTGTGQDKGTELFWNSEIPVWNNNRDRLVMYNKEGIVILDYSYNH